LEYLILLDNKLLYLLKLLHDKMLAIVSGVVCSWSWVLKGRTFRFSESMFWLCNLCGS